MTSTQWQSKVVPAQLSFLAIYNPSLGPTDETFRDQLVFYYSRAAHEARVAAKKHARKEGAGGDALREEENEKLRQIGLAQGMVDFAKSFSNDEPVDSIETEKSRIVLHEIEKGWWILASIDLTRLPSIQPVESSSKKKGENTEAKATVEYSSREVTPPALLLEQLLQAHATFGLHHGPSLADLYSRLGREKFCNTLDRFWSRFSRGWDVLLHGNPAVDIFGGLKLAGGGELGYGVGEEEWGSGEREVLEDLTRHTEGLVDVVVSRFGDVLASTESKSAPEDEQLPWMGSGTEPTASDGVIFSGMGALERRSLADVSRWIRQVYTYGDYAYGVRDNPLRERRKRRRKNPTESNQPTNGSIDHSESHSGSKIRTDRTTPVGETRRLSVDAARPSIPPPIVSAAEESLKKATQQHDKSDAEEVAEDGTTMGIPDQYMKYLTFGLSTLGKSTSKRRPTTASQTSNTSQATLRPPSNSHTGRSRNGALSGDEDDGPMLKNLEPIPDGDTLRSKMSTQIHLENKGYFLIGLRGDLDDLDEEDAVVSDDDDAGNSSGSRIVLRTLQVEVIPKVSIESDNDEPPSRKSSTAGIDPPDDSDKRFRRLRTLVYVRRPFIYCFLFEKQISSLQWTKFYKLLHLNLAPIHKPLLTSTDPGKAAERIESARNTASESETASVSSHSRSRSRQATANPIYHLIYDPRLFKLSTSVPNIPEPGTSAAEGILTALTGAGDSGTRTYWTRIEAMNVHSQILNTLSGVKGRQNEMERTSKTSRGWWVVWMKVRPSALEDDQNATHSNIDAASSTAEEESSNRVSGNPPSITGKDGQGDLHRMVFLVRKATDIPAKSQQPSTSSRAMSSMLSNMTFGMTGRDEDDTGGANTGWGPATLAGGIGVDARKYVDGLLNLHK